MRMRMRIAKNKLGSTGQCAHTFPMSTAGKKRKVSSIMRRKPVNLTLDVALRDWGAAHNPVSLSELVNELIAAT